jgi:glycosyltransferase involved in cell wall biosynthesis
MLNFGINYDYSKLFDYMTVLRSFEPSVNFAGRTTDLNVQYPTYEKYNPRLSSTQVIVAALNEEAGIGLTIAELKDNLDSPHILVVDGHSSDRTVEIAKNLGVEIAFQDGVGKGDAISKALKLTTPDADYVVLTDADFTYPAKHVPEMIIILEQNPDVGMVCGNRFNPQLDDKALINRFYLGNKLLAFSHNILNGIDLHDPLTGLRVIRAEILKNLKLKSNGFDIEVELNSIVQKKGYKTVEVPIQYRQRLGEKKLKMKHGATIFKRIMTEMAI